MRLRVTVHNEMWRMDRQRFNISRIGPSAWREIKSPLDTERWTYNTGGLTFQLSYKAGTTNRARN